MKFCLFNNLKYLCFHKLKHELDKTTLINEQMRDIIQYVCWQMSENKRPKIKDFNETIDELINTNKS